ncbi:MAG: glycine cleavage system protein H [Betaproteobacteria bacterium RIFCSPHIGHO2_12_FULL_69_13]|nr:MAG: glycine cleavage system protein H [Betaproteobacteria bacterium RIFCSPHIGHO2_12_FULL_69_13]OGA70042.1 MAG: glycine cleavage system protein H [Betaproteobacteria bacterium RIFCSPLOWO2_12_FULL_68_20]
MPTVRGCNLPDDLLYDVDNHIWFKEAGDGTVKLGMTTVATAMAGQLVAFTPKKVGRKVEAGKSCATVESGKWVGPAKSVAAGEVAAVNDALAAKPSLANEDPYGAGWLVILKPDDWAGAKAALTPGAQVAQEYEAKMDADGFAGCQA